MSSPFLVNRPTYAELRAELVSITDATGDPVLTDVEIDRALKNARVANPVTGYPPDPYPAWEANKVIPAGSYIVPTSRDGYFYYSAGGGTTGANEPSVWAASTVDNTVTWTRAGYAPWGGYYDLNRAARDLWNIKAARASKRQNVNAFGQTNQRTDVYAHAVERAQYYAGRIGGTIQLRGSSYRSIY